MVKMLTANSFQSHRTQGKMASPEISLIPSNQPRSPKFWPLSNGQLGLIQVEELESSPVQVLALILCRCYEQNTWQEQPK